MAMNTLLKPRTMRRLLGILLLLVAALACQRALPAKNVAIELAMNEAPAEHVGYSFFHPSSRSLYELVERLREIAEDKHQTGVLLRVGPFEGAYARVRELTRALRRIRTAKKPIHCHFETTDNAGYELLASSCDSISMSPSGTLDLAGVRAQAIFAGELLTTLGVNAELMQVGRFKGAADALTESSMPETTRSTLTAITHTLQTELVATVAHGRKRSPKQTQAAMDIGPLTAATAKEHGLIDAIAYVDEARQHLRHAAKVEKLVADPEEDEVSDLSTLIQELLTTPESPPSKPHIVLVPVTGTITSSTEPLDHDTGADVFIAEMKRLRDDENVAAVVLRIDSPGGSALASDLMWHAVYELRKKKPVFASVGGMAASGGYYIASAAKEIFAERTSLVGSIGVVGGKIAFADLAQKLGIHTETLRASPNAGWADPTTAFTESERAAVRQLLDTTYALFLRRVAQGRGVSIAKIEPVAEGRLMTGDVAKQGGLVDHLGGLLDTLEAARVAAKLPKKRKVYLWPPHQSPLESLFGQGAQSHAKAGSGIGAGIAALLANVPIARVLASNERVAALLPFALDMR